MWMVVFVTDKDAFTSPPHAMLLIVLLQSLQTSQDRRILFWLLLLSAECVITQWVEAKCLGLIVIEGFGTDRRIGGLEGRLCDGRHVVRRVYLGWLSIFQLQSIDRSNVDCWLGVLL